MRTGSGNRSYYNRTTGSSTARLYSKRTARKMSREVHTSQQERIRNVQYDALNDDPEVYDEYFDDLSYTKNKKIINRKNAVIIAVSVSAGILAVIIAILLIVKPGDSRKQGLVLDSASLNTVVAEAQEQKTEQAETDTALAAAALQPETTTTYEESDPPVIYGVMPIVVYSGHSVAYKQGIHVTDDNDPDATLEIDNNDVDLSTPGTYIVTYIARDRNGNATRVPTTVTVLEGQNVVSDEEIFALADSILDVIITEDENTDALKCLKVYEYLHSIGYVDEVHSEDWMQNAYWMLQRREGDCFCYYSAARLLLTRLGYDVMEVRNNNNYVHFWCLVSIDDGETWWHFDPTCWSWGEDGVLCLVSDTYLDEFTNRHKTRDGRLIHSWDRTNYPATPEYDFWTDEDRAVIYEDGLIELYPEYDENDDIWGDNQGWDYYPFGYGYDYYYDYAEDEVYPEETYIPEDQETEYSEDESYIDEYDTEYYEDYDEYSEQDEETYPSEHHFYIEFGDLE